MEKAVLPRDLLHIYAVLWVVWIWGLSIYAIFSVSHSLIAAEENSLRKRIRLTHVQVPDFIAEFQSYFNPALVSMIVTHLYSTYCTAKLMEQVLSMSVTSKSGYRRCLFHELEECEITFFCLCTQHAHVRVIIINMQPWFIPMLILSDLISFKVLISFHVVGDLIPE